MSARRRLRFTRQGKYFVGLTLGIGFAAINTGNNLLHLVLGMMLALIIASGILSELTLRRLRVLRQLPRRIFANQPFLTGIVLHNDKRRAASYSIEAQEVEADGARHKRCFFLKVPPNKNQHTRYQHVLVKRGHHRLTGFRLRTRFPFSLFEKSRRVAATQDLLVYPEIVPLDLPALRSIAPGYEGAARPGRRGDFHGLRGYREGDDPRDIFWRKSAKVGRLLTREHEDPRGKRVTIFLDNGASANESPEQAELLEQAVSRAASLAAHFVALGHPVALITRSLHIPSGIGEKHLDRLLRSLALADFVPAEAQLDIGSLLPPNHIPVRLHALSTTS